MPRKHGGARGWTSAEVPASSADEVHGKKKDKSAHSLDPCCWTFTSVEQLRAFSEQTPTFPFARDLLSLLKITALLTYSSILMERGIIPTGSCYHRSLCGFNKGPSCPRGSAMWAAIPLRRSLGDRRSQSPSSISLIVCTFTSGLHLFTINLFGLPDSFLPPTDSLSPTPTTPDMS